MKKFRVDYLKTVYGELVKRIYIEAENKNDAYLKANKETDENCKFIEVMEVK